MGMSRTIIGQDEGYPLMVNTHWGGKEECSQLTFVAEGWENGYLVMTREQALEFFKEAAKRLEKQIEEDKTDPPWWQGLSQKPEPMK